MNVDDKDNDPIVLLTYVATALDRVSPIDASVFEALSSPGASVEGTIVPRLGAALAAADEPLVLALDDLHLLHDRTCLDAVATLARHVRDGSQLALSARGAPALELGALRAQGLELEIGPDDLRMDAEQAGVLLRAAGVELPDAEVAELAAHTEGWSAGLYLAALSIRARARRDKLADGFSGSDLLVSDYLQSELLAELSADELRFLTRTSVLDRLSGPLCDAVLEEQWIRVRARVAAHSNLFLVPLDPGGEWYRYHHLFQELLRSALSRAEPDLVARPAGAGSRVVRGARGSGAGDRVRAAGRRRRSRGAARRAVRPARVPERPRHDRRALVRVAGGPRWHSSATRWPPCSARCSPRCGAGRRRRSAGPRRPSSRSPTTARPTAAARSTPGWSSCARTAASVEWRGCARTRSSRSSSSSPAAGAGRTRWCCSGSRGC